MTVLAGSDACNPGDFPGAGLHLELTKLVESGFTAEKLRTVDALVAKLLNRGDNP